MRYAWQPALIMCGWLDAWLGAAAAAAAKTDGSSDEADTQTVTNRQTPLYIIEVAQR